MIHRLVLVFAALALAPFSAPAAPKWYEEFAPAQKQAQAENKRILIDFTGSTWCPACIQLHKEVFTTKAFQDYAEKNLVLMKVDFPDPVSEPKVGDDFVKRYLPGDVQLPSIIVTSADGKRLGAVEYDPNEGKTDGFLKKMLSGSKAKKEASGPAEAFIAKLEKVAKK